MKGQKGITLVALVITIIVMLILTGATIALTLESGLLNRANEAKTETNKAAEEDNELVNGTINNNGNKVDIFNHWLNNN